MANKTFKVDIDLSNNRLLSGNSTLYQYSISLSNHFLGGSGNATTSGNFLTAVGQGALSSINTGVYNSAFGTLSGKLITSGSYNSILGSYQGTPALEGNVILSDGHGNIRAKHDGINWILSGEVSAVNLSGINTGDQDLSSYLQNVSDDINPQLSGDLDLNNFNIVGIGLLDGRDVSADGVKLDTIEISATADQAASEVPITDVGALITAIDVEGALSENRVAINLNTLKLTYPIADSIKLSGIEPLADVTDALNVAASGAVMEGDTTTISMSFVIDEDSMLSNSSTKIPTQQSVKAYVDASGVAIWGSITGTLSTQTDLQNSLNLKANLVSPTFTGTVGGITKTMVGLGNVNNTTDLLKPISIATQSTLDLKENISNKDALSGYAGLDANGKINPAQLPALAISDTFVVSSEVSMLTLTAQVGDIAIRTDENKSYILRVTGATVLSNWQELLTPSIGVSSIFGRSGTVAAQLGDYTTTIVTEGTNLYYTEARVSLNSAVVLNTAKISNIVQTSVTGNAGGLSSTLVSGSGGTGFSAYTKGDILYSSATNVLSKLQVGTLGQVLSVGAGLMPVWAAASQGVTNVTGSLPIISNGGDTPNISLAYTTVNNFIRSAIPLTGAISTSDWILYNDSTDDVVKRGLVSELPFVTSIGGLVPYTGAALSVNLGVHSITASNVSGNNTGDETQSTINALNVTAAGLSTTLSPSSGGTGISSYTVGNILYASGVSTLSILTPGAVGEVLIMNGGVPSWGAGHLGDITAINITANNGLTTGSGTDIVNTASGVHNQTISLRYTSNGAGKLNFIENTLANPSGTTILGTNSIVYHDTISGAVKKGLISDLPFVTNNNQIANGRGFITSFTDTNTQLTNAQVIASLLTGFTSFGSISAITATDSIFTGFRKLEYRTNINDAKVSDINHNVTTNLSIGVRDAVSLTINSSDGTNASIPAVSITEAGLMSKGDKVKINGIATGANNYILPFTPNTANWDAAYNWGDHALAGYLTSYTDTNTWRGITGAPTLNDTATSISSGWAYNHALSSTAHPRDTRSQIAGTYNPTIGYNGNFTTTGKEVIDTLYLTNGVITNVTTRFLTASLSGSGTTNYLPKFTGSTTLGNSLIYDDGVSVTINGSTILYSPSTNNLMYSVNMAGDSGRDALRIYNTDKSYWNDFITTDKGYVLDVGTRGIVNYEALSARFAGNVHMAVFGGTGLGVGTNNLLGYKLNVNGTGYFASNVTINSLGGDTLTLTKSNNIPAFKLKGAGTDSVVIEGGNKLNVYINGISRYTIDSSGNNTWSGSGSFAGTLTAASFKGTGASLTVSSLSSNNTLILENTINILGTSATGQPRLEPVITGIVDLGGSTKRFENLWLSANADIQGSLTAGSGTFSGTTKVYNGSFYITKTTNIFSDPTIFIGNKSDGSNVIASEYSGNAYANSEPLSFRVSNTSLGRFEALSIASSGTVSITTAITSTSTTTGALVVTGGVGVGGTLNVGGNIDIAGEGKYSKQQYINYVLLTTNDTLHTVAWNLSTQPKATLKVTATTGTTLTFDAPTNVKDGATYTVVINNVVGGLLNLGFNGVYNFGAAGMPTFSNVAGKRDILTFEGYGTELFYLGIRTGY